MVLTKEKGCIFIKIIFRNDLNPNIDRDGDAL